ncbi:MAG: hypothetical protein ACKVQR_13330 [Aquabacterium sp.]
MDVESPEHLERLRQQPEVKAALLLRGPLAGADQCRFERAAKNTLYWPAIEDLALRMRAEGRSQVVREERTFYGRPCWLLAICLSPAADGPFTIAVVAADSEPAEVLEALLQRVSRDYWFGSRFFK